MKDNEVCVGGSHASVYEVEAQGQAGKEGHAEAQAQEDWRSAWTEKGGV